MPQPTVVKADEAPRRVCHQRFRHQRQNLVAEQVLQPRDLQGEDNPKPAAPAADGPHKDEKEEEGDYIDEHVYFFNKPNNKNRTSLIHGTCYDNPPT